MLLVKEYIKNCQYSVVSCMQKKKKSYSFIIDYYLLARIPHIFLTQNYFLLVLFNFFFNKDNYHIFNFIIFLLIKRIHFVLIFT